MKASLDQMDPVTEADLRVQDLIVREVKSRFPGLLIIGEEEAAPL